MIKNINVFKLFYCAIESANIIFFLFSLYLLAIEILGFPAMMFVFFLRSFLCAFIFFKTKIQYDNQKLTF
jgi:hypothetical protein